MPAPHEIIQRIHAAWEREPLVNLHRSHLDAVFEGDRLRLTGAVGSIAAKRAAAKIAARYAPQMVDNIRVDRGETSSDGAIKDALVLAFHSESAFHNCHITVHWHNQHEMVANVQDENPCLLDISICDATVVLEGTVWSLSHQRMAEVLAWWSPGVTNVINRIDVVPEERDIDAEIQDAVMLVLDKDPLVHSGQIHVDTAQGVVTLEGLVPAESERQNAEDDVWYLSGVQQVVNLIEVRPGGHQP